MLHYNAILSLISGYFWCRYCGKRGGWSELKENIEVMKNKKANRFVFIIY